MKLKVQDGKIIGNGVTNVRFYHSQGIQIIQEIVHPGVFMIILIVEITHKYIIMIPKMDRLAMV